MITETLIYDTLMEVMDQVEKLDRKVTRLLSAAGLEDASVLAADGRPEHG